MKLVTVGCITKYTIDDIKPYVNSILRSGYTGRKIMIVYDVTKETMQFLTDKGWEVYQGNLKQHVILQRFADVSALLDSIDDDIVIWTDVKDVVFQDDPFGWLVYNKEKPIIATSEAIKLIDEEWANVNCGTSFPTEWEHIKHHPSYCAGVVVGDRLHMRDLFNEIYRWTFTSQNKEQLTDQAAFNVIIHLQHVSNNIQFANQNNGLAVHMGISWVKRHILQHKVLEEPPFVTEDGTVVNLDGMPWPIVHQYDRDPKLKQLIINKYA